MSERVTLEVYDLKRADPVIVRSVLCKRLNLDLDNLFDLNRRINERLEVVTDDDPLTKSLLKEISVKAYSLLNLVDILYDIGLLTTKGAEKVMCYLESFDHVSI